MKWLLALAMLAMSSAYLYRHYVRLAAPPPAPVKPAAPIKPKATAFFSPEDLERIKESTRDLDPQVRWAALQLLFALGEPNIIGMLEDSVGNDTNAQNRRKALGLLQQRKGVESLQGMLRGLRDSEKDVRMAALQAIAESGEPAAIPSVAETASNDSEPEVKAEALRVLGLFQDQRRRAFDELTAQLRRDYEEAVQRASSKRSNEE